MKIKFSYIMLLMALVVAGCAGYFSVWGLSQLFAGASTAVIIMATGLEIAKVITTTALHRYWGKISNWLKVYATTSVIVLMLITSAGIYGFLSNAYQMTANKLEIHEGELSVLDGKKSLFEKSIADNEKIVATKNKRIDQLTNLRSNQETRLDSAKTNRNRDKVRGDIGIATNEIQKLSNDIDILNNKNSVLSDSVNKYNTKALELKSGSAVAAEVGPLKYIAELTGYPMGKVVNVLILLLIFVFDPLAIALILMTNRIFQLEGESNPIEEKKTEVVVKQIIEEKIVPIIEEDETIIEEKIVPIIEEEEEEEEIIIEEEDESIIEEEIDSPITKREPVIPTGKIELSDIKDRPYSVPVPQPKTNNTVQRIGSNKVIKNGDNDKFIFKRK